MSQDTKTSEKFQVQKLAMAIVEKCGAKNTAGGTKEKPSAQVGRRATMRRYVDEDGYEILGVASIDASSDGKLLGVNAEEGARSSDLDDDLINSEAADGKQSRPSVFGDSLSLEDNKKSGRRRIGPALRLGGRDVKLGSLLQLGNGKKGGRGMQYRTKLHYGGFMDTNSSAGKYLLQFPGGGTMGTFPVNLIANGGEWSSFNSVFEEFFIHSVTLRFMPNNMNLANFINSTSTNLQTCMGVLACYQHDQAAPTDGSSTFYQMQNSPQSKVIHTGKPFTITWKNIEKFDKNGTVGDASTAQHSQAWLNMADVAKYGGYIGGALPYATNAAASSTTFLVNVQFGVILCAWDISFRYRD